MRSKLKRFHVDLYYPIWWEESIDNMLTSLAGKQLVCSYHATKKYKNFSREYQKAIRNLLATTDLAILRKEYIFEFYANDKQEIKKICVRFPMNGELRCDIIFVISSTGKLITIFLNKNFDPHTSLDKNLYEQGDV